MIFEVWRVSNLLDFFMFFRSFSVTIFAWIFIHFWTWLFIIFLSRKLRQIWYFRHLFFGCFLNIVFFRILERNWTKMAPKTRSTHPPLLRQKTILWSAGDPFGGPWLALAPFWLHFGCSWHPFGSILDNFGSIFDQKPSLSVPSPQSICNKSQTPPTKEIFLACMPLPPGPERELAVGNLDKSKDECETTSKNVWPKSTNIWILGCHFGAHLEYSFRPGSVFWDLVFGTFPGGTPGVILVVFLMDLGAKLVAFWMDFGAILLQVLMIVGCILWQSIGFWMPFE